MINPNTRHTMKATVTEVTRNSDGTLRHLIAENKGYKFEAALGLKHKTVIVGDYVSLTLGFRIMSDWYVIENVRKVHTKFI